MNKTLLMILSLLISFILLLVTRLALADEVIKIAIIDTGYDPILVERQALIPLKLCAFGHYDFRTKSEFIGHTLPHGTMVASIIAEELKDVSYCAVIYQVFNNGIPFANLSSALAKAANEKVKFVNYSLDGPVADDKEYKVFSDLVLSGIEVFVAAGNLRLNLSKSCGTYPTCYGLPGIIPVGAGKSAKRKEWYSNYGKYVKTWRKGEFRGLTLSDDGTSYAAPRALADRIKQFLNNKPLTTKAVK